MESYLLQLLGEKNHLGFDQMITEREAMQNGLLNCQHHAYLKEEMVRHMVPLITEKVEFTEEYKFEWNAQKVRANVYVFSPQEIKRIARDVDSAIGMRDDEIKRLQWRLSDPAPESAVTASHYLAELRLGGLNEAQKHIERLEKQLLDYASVCIATPVYIMDTRFKEAEVSIAARDTRIKELAGQVKNLEEYVAKGVVFRDELQARNKALKAEAAEHKEAAKIETARAENNFMAASRHAARIAALEAKLVYAGVHCTALASDIKYTLNEK